MDKLHKIFGELRRERGKCPLWRRLWALPFNGMSCPSRDNRAHMSDVGSDLGGEKSHRAWKLLRFYKWINNHDYFDYFNLHLCLSRVKLRNWNSITDSKIRTPIKQEMHILDTHKPLVAVISTEILQSCMEIWHFLFPFPLFSPILPPWILPLRACKWARDLSIMVPIMNTCMRST